MQKAKAQASCRKFRESFCGLRFGFGVLPPLLALPRFVDSCRGPNLVGGEAPFQICDGQDRRAGDSREDVDGGQAQGVEISRWFRPCAMPESSARLPRG